MLGPTPSRVIKIAKEKSQKFLTTESEKFSFKIDRFLTVYHGYNQIKPKIFPKRLTTMFSADVVVPSEDDNRPDFFQASPLTATSSLRRHQRERGLREGQVDTSSKIRIVLPANAAAAAAAAAQTNDLGRLTRTKKTAGPKTPTKVVLTTPKRIRAGNEGILCSSVMLTYKEGLFYHEKDMVRNDSDV